MLVHGPSWEQPGRLGIPRARRAASRARGGGGGGPTGAWSGKLSQVAVLYTVYIWALMGYQVYMLMYTHVYMHMYICIQTERERESLVFIMAW